ncbi:hypothetical protein [Brevundimonas sp. UBA2416]|uniref:hypothetical protein n=1 Tax=Brevundimonas sp. UBA2416 TaxID=1946124 RepID=UPI0025BD7197|nr:hypothetical protein [Brevundimonas sp. UBA2416]
MSSRSPEQWSLTRSLAFLAAIFAVVFATLLPSAVAASAAAGEPVVLCSGDRIMVVFDPDGSSEPSSMDTLDCADCVLSALTTLPPPPVIRPVAPPRIVAVQPDLPRAGPWRGGLLLAGLPPPSTAPPTA